MVQTSEVVDYKVPRRCLSILQPGTMGFPNQSANIAGDRTLFVAIIFPHGILGLCIERHGVYDSSSISFAMIRVPVDNGNANSSNSSFKVTIVDVAQFCDLLKLAFTAVNCRPYVCFRDKPSFHHLDIQSYQ